MITEKQIEEHINKKSFGLYDFGKTLNKYKGYKPQQTKEFFKENKENISFYLNDKVFNSVLSSLKFKFETFNYLDLFKLKLTKKKINAVMTIINNLTYEQNINFISSLKYFNKNTQRTYAIFLYLKNYNLINKIMKNVLKEFFKDYNRKTIIKNLN